MINRYELSYLISPDSPSEKTRELEQKIENIIKEEKGVISEINTPSKRDLARLIKEKLKPKLGTALLTSLTFSIDAGKIKHIETKLKEEKSIVRYILLKQPAKKTRFSESKTPRAPRKQPQDVTKPDKSKLEEIEKKLEQILENV